MVVVNFATFAMLQIRNFMHRGILICLQNIFAVDLVLECFVSNWLGPPLLFFRVFDRVFSTVSVYIGRLAA